MFNWDDVRFFLAVQREGNLARAGTALHMDATTVGRRLQQLEQQLDARLFDRTTRGFVLTPAGHRLLPRAEGIEREVLAVDRDLAGDDHRLEGTVRLTATEMMTTRFIAPYLSKFHARYPQIELDVRCSNATVDLARREADIALRLARPRQEDIVVKKLFEIHLALYASAEYVDRFGMPDSANLQGHRFLAFSDTNAFRRENEWLLEHVDAEQVVFRSDSVSSVMSATQGGLGIALLPCHPADDVPGLVRTPLRGSPQPRIVWQAVHQDLVGVSRIRAVLDWLGRLFAPRHLRPVERTSA